ncbi:MAG: DeoR/GlpR family DNA-binding transcription regulator [Nocardioidaceae bacterium]
MNSKARRQQIERLLSTHGEATVDQLAAWLSVTASTIRRDLTRLTAQGAITRTYGGAIAALHTHTEPSVRQRTALARAEKDAIGCWAAGQIQEGETVMLDAGTTTGRLAHHLRDRESLTVITNGLTSVLELAAADGVDVIVLGGSLRHISQGLVGPLTDLMLTRLTADRVFLGADSLVAGRGICEASVVQTRTKEQMAERGRHLYVLVDSSKLGRSPFDAWAPLQRPYTLVTDDGATDEQLAPFRANADTNVVIVPAARQPGPELQAVKTT